MSADTGFLCCSFCSGVLVLAPVPSGRLAPGKVTTDNRIAVPTFFLFSGGFFYDLKAWTWCSEGSKKKWYGR